MFLLKFLILKLVLAAREPPTVTIENQGTIQGMVVTMFRTQRILAYLGIPYAQPPINEKRFAPPVVDNLPKWDMTKNSTELMPDCWSDTRKPLKKHEEAFLKLLGAKYNASQFNEDCLYLNIYLPEDPPPKDGYAVIVWLHSGDFTSGNASMLNPFHLVFKQKVIIVTVSFRLGIFGFFTTMDGEAPGNFGLMDQSAALLWINTNIKVFGGNEKSVTLMGHGSGAISCTLHLTSGEWSEELFDKVIIMSGTSIMSDAVRTPAAYSNSLDRIADVFGCFRLPTPSLLSCLRRVDAKNLMDSSPVMDWGPVIDEGLSNTTTPFIPHEPRILLEQNGLRKIPILIGFTDMEDTLDITTGEIIKDGITMEMYDTLVGDVIISELSQLETNDSCGGNNQAVLDALNFVYKPFPPIEDPMMLRKKFIDFSVERNFIAPSMLLATVASKLPIETYVYRFDFKPSTKAALQELPDWIGVPHHFDLIFVWGIPYWLTLENQTQWETSDKRISDIIMTMWANFAKYSNPTSTGVYIKWDKFIPQNQGVLIIDRSFNMSDSTRLNYQSVQFWNDYYQKVISFSAECCNVTSTATSITFLELHANEHRSKKLLILLEILFIFMFIIRVQSISS